MDPGPPEQDPTVREPLLNAPWPSLALVGVILGSYAWQTWWGGGDAAALRLGFSPSDLDQGRWVGVVGILFVHGGWPHAIMNALGALAFGPPIARLLGGGLGGAMAFFGFYLLCGGLSTLGYAALHLHQEQLVVGASGAVSGLMGAAARLYAREGVLLPVLSRPVISLGLAWTVVNLLLAILGFAPLMDGARVAWEAHIAGFLAGVLLIGPWRSLLGQRPSR